MPNWCEGNIRLRGKRENIVNFLKSEFSFVATPRGNFLGTIQRELVFEDDGYEFGLKFPADVEDAIWPTMYINGTHRNFIESDSIEVYGDKPEITVCIDNFKAAWGVDAAPYLEKARKHGVDIRIVGFEKGMEFMQVIEIVDGNIIRNDETEYDDWMWECPMPNMGG